jgi:hypothetical protein
MTEQFEHTGAWWDPADFSRQWAGSLRFDRREGLSLRLTVTVDRPTLSPVGEIYELLHGVTAAGVRITLFHCYRVSSRGSLFGLAAPVDVEIHANAAVVGFHTELADPLLLSVSLSTRHLNDWWGGSGIEWDQTVKSPNIVVRYTGVDPLVLYDDGDFRISFKAEVDASVRSQSASLLEQARFEIVASHPSPLSEFQRRIRACGDFISIACLTLCEVQEIELMASENEGQPVRGTFHAVPVHHGDDRRSSVVVHMLFRFHDVSNHLPDLFRGWLSLSEVLHDSRALYFAGAYGGDFIEGKLLSLAQAAEAFHRRFHEGLYIDRKAFQKSILKPLLAALPPDTDERVKKSVEDKLRYAHEYSQRDRFEDLVRKHHGALEVLVRDPMVYVPAIVKHRNAFTHFDPKSRKSGTHDAVEPERVLLYNYFLRLLMEACFLETMGFSIADITALFQRSETYRQLSARFLPWAIPAGPAKGAQPD